MEKETKTTQLPQNAVSGCFNNKHKTLINKLENAKKALHNVQRTIYNILDDYEEKEYYTRGMNDDTGAAGINIDESMAKIDDVIYALKI